MKTPIMGLMLGMLAVGGLMAVGALYNSQAVYAQLDISPSNAAVAANSNNQPVTQTNAAAISQSSETKCKASVSDDDVAQVGDNVNTAANDCDTDQGASVSQSNDNTQITTQNALALACQANAGLGSNVCGNVGQNGGGGNGGEQLEVICHVPEGNPEQARTLVLPESAAEAHLEQHELDHPGPCTGSEGD